MTFTAEERAQTWHDTDHGSCEEGSYSSCWCCCTVCDPDWGHDRPNPFYAEAAEQLAVAIKDPESRGEASR